MKEAKVYWAARNLADWWNPLGNHHFVLIKTAATILTVNPVEYKGEKFMTLGAFSVNGLLKFEANNWSDVNSVKNRIDNPGGWGEADMDLQKHRVAPPYGVDLWFAQGLVVHSLRFHENTTKQDVPYELFGDNCSAFVNTVFKVVGVPPGERRRAGQFWGIDAGERLELPEWLFEERKSYVPEPPVYDPGQPAAPRNPYPGQQRTHVVKTGEWLSKIAITYYGDMNKWTVIYNHPQNKQTIGPNPDMIKPGQRLVIP